MRVKKRVAVVGATGIAGQQFLTALHQHPWFEVARLAGSARSAGKTYEDALRAPNGQIGWWQSETLAPAFRSMVVEPADELNLNDIDIVFTAIDADAARQLEPKYATQKPVISTASAYRMEADVPLLIPGINSPHAAILKQQRETRGWKGFIVPIPNCTTYGLACTLAPLQARFGLKTVIMTSMQATSGAGRNGGVLALDMLDNLVPYIPKEEEKVEVETQKILGAFDGKNFRPASFLVSCTCTRVPVTDGHTEAVFIATERPAAPDEVAAAFREFKPDYGDLPSAPKNFFTVHDDPFHPQPRIDRDLDQGMSTHVGRIRAEKALGGIKYVLLSHNTKAGAARGALLVAEQLTANGMI